jgi:hypothetical protein
MSHFATNWAIQQRGLEAATKVLLWHLADCHNPAQGCFPTQAYLADRSELSRASVNRHLAILEQRGLIVRERLFDAERQRQLPTRYYLAFEPDFEQHRDRLAASPKRGLKPCRNPGHGAESQITDEPSLKSKKSRVSDCDTNPVIEPAKEPTKSAQAREGLDFFKLWETWPASERPQKQSYAKDLFARLTPGERDRAVQFAGSFRAFHARQGGFAPMIPYLRDRQFLEFDGAPEIDRDGYFVIRAGCDEWRAWLDHYRCRCSEKIVASMEERGFLLTHTRWPAEKFLAIGSQWNDPATRPPAMVPRSSTNASSRQWRGTDPRPFPARGVR